MSHLTVLHVAGFGLGAEPPKVFHEVSLQHRVLSCAGHPAARVLHCVHASLWIIKSILPGRCASRSIVVSPRRPTTFFRRTAVSACVNR